jgi:2-methylcitrate dehydratase PrpD
VRVEVQLRNGKRLERAQEKPRGSDENFASPADIIAKFENLSRRALPAKRAAELRDAVLGLEKLDDAARIAALLQ